MPFIKKTQRAGLKATNEEGVVTWGSTELQHTPYFDLLRAIAATVDDAIKGEQCYLTIGLIKDQSAVSFVRHDGILKTGVYTAGLDEVAG